MHEAGQAAWSAIAQEFSGIGDPEAAARVAVRLGMAALLAGLIGYERERRGKPAGLRTHMLVSLGAALFVLASLQAGMRIGDLSRVLQGVVAGIGFLGAGAIIKSSSRYLVKGLTTAATIWLAAALGAACGMGSETTALAATVFGLLILAALRVLERRLERPGRRSRRRPLQRAGVPAASRARRRPANCQRASGGKKLR